MKFDVRPEIVLDGSNNPQGAATMFWDHNDMRLSVRATDETFGSGGDMKGLSLCAKKADAFEMRYDVGTNKPSFRFMTGCRIQEKDVRMRFKHSMMGKGATTMEMGVDMNDQNHMTVCYDLSGYDKPDIKRMSVKWRYTHDDLTVEPGYNFGTESLFADVKYRLDDENRLRMNMDMHTNNALLEWTNSSGMGGGGDMRITATMNTDDGLNKMPTIKAEKYWTLDW